jgi:outer membrane murein-binding lipoprotein Lpp
MHRHLIAVAGVLLLAAPALAQDAASGVGRYQIAPSDEGFTRLDTETGSLSHCTKSDGVWRCEPLGGPSGLDQQLDDLSGQVGQLSTDLDALTARLDALATRVDALATRPTTTDLDTLAARVDALASRVDALAARPSAEAAPAQDEAGLVQQAVRRLLDMVRQMKHVEVGNS